MPIGDQAVGEPGNRHRAYLLELEPLRVVTGGQVDKLEIVAPESRLLGGIAMANEGNTSKRGFASMDEEKVKEIASKGGKAAHEKALLTNLILKKREKLEGKAVRLFLKTAST